MQKFLDFLNGKKTYIAAGLIVILTELIIGFHIVIPEYIWIALGAMGLGFIKASIPSDNIQLNGLAQNIFATKWGKYLVPVIMGILAALVYIGVPIPEFVWTALTALGFTSLRANIEVAKNADPNTK